MHYLILALILCLLPGSSAESPRAGSPPSAAATCALVDFADFILEWPEKEQQEMALQTEFKELARRSAAGELSAEEVRRLEDERLRALTLEMYEAGNAKVENWAEHNGIPLVLDGALPELGKAEEGNLVRRLMGVFVLFKSASLDQTDSVRSDLQIPPVKAGIRIGVVDIEGVISSAMAAGQTAESAFASALEQTRELAVSGKFDLVLRSAELPVETLRGVDLKFAVSGKTVLYSAPDCDLTKRVKAAVLGQKLAGKTTARARVQVVADLSTILDRYSRVQEFEADINGRIERYLSQGGDPKSDAMAEMQREIDREVASMYSEVCVAIAELARREKWDLVLRHGQGKLDASSLAEVKLKISAKNVVHVDAACDRTDAVLQHLEAKRKR